MEELKQYYQTGYNLGRNGGKEGDALESLIEKLSNNYDGLKNEYAELHSETDQMIEKIIEVKNNVNTLLEESTRNLETIRKKFINRADNLLLIHPITSPSKISNKEGVTNSDINSSEFELSFSWPTAIFFIIVGLLSLGTAFLIPDDIVMMFFSGAVPSIGAKMGLKIVLFGSAGGLTYLIVAKLIASKQDQGDRLQYYLFFLALVIILFIISLIIQESSLTIPLLIFIGINGFIHLPLGLSLFSFYYRRTNEFVKIRKRIGEQLDILETKISDFEKAKKHTTNDLMEEFDLLHQQKKNLQLGYEEGYQLFKRMNKK